MDKLISVKDACPAGCAVGLAQRLVMRAVRKRRTKRLANAQGLLL
jgi:hypothetical protein